MGGASFGLIFGGVGVLMLVIAGVLFLRQRQFAATALPANGVVVGMRTSRDDDGMDTYAPVVDFRTQAGGEARYESSLYSRPTKYKVGDRVEVLYNPAKPSDAQIKGRAMNYVGVIIVGGLGVLFTFLGVVLGIVVRG